jgi:hypothetical protein
MNLQDFLKLAGKQGKVVVLGEDGNVKGVFLPMAEYQKLSGVKSPEKQKEDIIEKVNREILQAQLEEVISSADAAIGNSETETQNPGLPQYANNAERIDSLLNKRAQDLFKSMPYDFTAPEVTSMAGDEEIKPNFDDI